MVYLLDMSRVPRNVFKRTRALKPIELFYTFLDASGVNSLKYIITTIFLIYFERVPSVCGHNPGQVFRRVQDAGGLYKSVGSPGCTLPLS